MASSSSSTSTSDDIRLKSRSLFSSSLSTGLSSLGDSSLSSSSSSSSDYTSLSEQIESAIFASFDGDSGNAYRDAIRQKSLVLKKNNPEVGRKLLTGEMTVEEFAAANASDLQTPSQSLSDARLAQDNLQQSLGMTNNFGDDVGAVQPARPVSPSQQDMDSGFVGAAEDMMGGEGEFASRKQPKVGKAMEGVEFETP